MAEFRQMIVTKKGQELIQRVLAGEGNIEFTKVSLSEKSYSDEEIFNLENFGDVNQTEKITRISKLSDAAVQVECNITNEHLNTGYYFKSVALYAKITNGEEIVYSVCGASKPGWMPPFSGVSVSSIFLKLITAVQNASKVTISVNPAGIVTIDDVIALDKKVTESKSNLDNQIKTINEEIENLKQNSNSNTLDETTFKTFQNFINEQIEEIKNNVNMLGKKVSDSALTRIKAIAGNSRFIQSGGTYKYQSPPIEIKNGSIEKWDFVKEKASIFEKSMSFNPIIESDGTISKFEVSESCILIYNIILNISSINKNRDIIINLTIHDHHFEINMPACKTNYTFSGILILNKGDTLKPQIIIENNGIETVENLTLGLSLTKLVTNFLEETKQMIMQ